MVKNRAIEDLLPKAGMSTYRLVRMASKRALELSEGKPCLVSDVPNDKLTSMALEEIAQGKVVYKHAEEKNRASKAAEA